MTTENKDPMNGKQVPLNPIFKTTDKKTFGTMDGFDNFASRVGLNNDNALSDSMYTFNFITRNRVQLEAAYRGSWVVGAIIDSIADDMTRAGVIVTTNEGEEDIKDFQAAISKKKLWDSLNSFIKWYRLYGGALCLIQIKGQKLDTPLNLDTVGKDQFEGLCTFDRWQLIPDLTTMIKSGPDMGLPEFYNLVTTASAQAPTAAVPVTGQIKMHHSRVIRGIGIELPFWQALTEQFWGESVLERLWDRLISYDNATLSAANLIDRANLRTVGIEGLREIISAGGQAQQGLERMFDMMRLMQVNEGLTLLDKEDTFQSTAYSFSGLSDMLLQFGQQLSGASEIPLVRLLGQTPAGLGATGEGEIRMYYDSINAKQESKLRPGLDVVLRVLWRSTFGKPEPKDFGFTFAPLWQMSAMDKANIAKTQTETILGAYEADLTDKPTAMKELRGISADTGLFNNISDEAVLKAEKNALTEEPPMPEISPNESLTKEVVPQMDSKKSFVDSIKSKLGLKK